MPYGSQCGVECGAAPITAPRLGNAVLAGHLPRLGQFRLKNADGHHSRAIDTVALIIVCEKWAYYPYYKSWTS